MKRVMIIVFLVLLICGCGGIYVVPSDRQILSLDKGAEPMPGWYAVSGGFLREIYQKCGGAQ